jgi:hypothetical protein
VGEERPIGTGVRVQMFKLSTCASEELIAEVNELVKEVRGKVERVQLHRKFDAT